MTNMKYYPESIKENEDIIFSESLFSKVSSCYLCTKLSVRDAQTPLTPFLDMSYLGLVFLPMAQSCAPVQSAHPSNTPPQKAKGSITPLQQKYELTYSRVISVQLSHTGTTSSKGLIKYLILLAYVSGFSENLK